MTGVFLPLGEDYNHRPLYQKGDDPNEFLLCAKNTTWMVTNRVGMEKNDSSGCGTSVEKGLLHPILARQWKVSNGSKFQVQAAVVASALVGPPDPPLQAPRPTSTPRPTSPT